MKLQRSKLPRRKMANRDHIPWSAAELDDAADLRSESMAYVKIAAYFGRSNWCELQRLLKARGRRERIDDGIRARASNEQIAEATARREASYRRSFTQEFFNDPPPGYSALDRRRRA